MILFLAHNVQNIGWYKALYKGKYNGVRVVQTVINLLLLMVMIGAMVSGKMLSRDVLAFLHLKAGSFGRKLHMISMAWSFSLMSMHLGLHWGIITTVGKKAAVNEGKATKRNWRKGNGSYNIFIWDLCYDFQADLE